MLEYSFTTDTNPVVDYLFSKLDEHLKASERVVWLLSGGSAIETAVRVSQLLARRDLSRLSVSLVDERFGPVGHPNENWRHLLAAGLTLETADTYRPLQGLTRQATAKAFSDWLHDRLNRADFSLGLFGIGSDGHTAGIKPHSPAVSEQAWVSAYTGEDYERLTITFPVIQLLDEVVVQALGADKAEVIYRLLQDDAIPLEEMPAAIFTRVKQNMVFSNHKEGAQ